MNIQSSPSPPPPPPKETSFVSIFAKQFPIETEPGDVSYINNKNWIKISPKIPLLNTQMTKRNLPAKSNIRIYLDLHIEESQVIYRP